MNKKYNILKCFLQIIILLVLCVTLLITYFSFNTPESFFVNNGNELQIDSMKLVVSSEYKSPTLGKADFVSSEYNKSYASTLKLFNIFPIKDIKVERVEQVKVHLGGGAFGIKLYTDGVLVIDVSTVISNGISSSPARDCGIKNGDYIISMNNYPVFSNEDVKFIIGQSKGKPISVLYRRNNKKLSTTLTALKSDVDGDYKGAFWVRDSTAGIGTMTFYDPATLRFGGLGHPVNDTQINTLMEVKSGEICKVVINNVTKGTSGHPGSLGGYFVNGPAMGTITHNNQSGIYGTLYSPDEHPRSIPLALKQEVTTGKAQIFCTLDDGAPKAYDIEITAVDINANQAVKNMTIKVTDPDLLSQTGGIVQGMSGSPIIQNGKLIGAVTHVFVNNPTKGYGIFAEHMYNLVSRN